MDEESASKSDGPEPDQGSSDTQAPKVVNGIEAAEPPNEKHLHNIEREEREIKRELNAFERTGLKWTRASFGITAITCLFIAFQWIAMREQLNEMKSSGQTSTDQANRVIENMNWLAKSMDWTLKQSRAAIEASEKQSMAALDASVNTSRNDQRAWIGVTGVAGPRLKDSTGREVYLIENRPVHFEATALNTGKSPAFSTHTLTSFHILPATTAFSPIYAVRDKKGTVVVQPQMELTLFDKGKEIPSREIIAALKDAGYILYFYGIINYADQFKRSHETKWCMFIVPTLDNFLPCTTYNDAN